MGGRGREEEEKRKSRTRGDEGRAGVIQGEEEEGPFS